MLQKEFDGNHMFKHYFSLSNDLNKTVKQEHNNFAIQTLHLYALPDNMAD